MLFCKCTSQFQLDHDLHCVKNTSNQLNFICKQLNQLHIKIKYIMPWINNIIVCVVHLTKAILVEQVD